MVEPVFDHMIVSLAMGHLYNEPIAAETDRTGRLVAYRWRGERYAVVGVLGTYGSELHRVRVSGGEGVAVAELARDGERWRLRHLFRA
jgi:hypothetical protein